jgi:VWFA-related protein
MTIGRSFRSVLLVLCAGALFGQDVVPPVPQHQSVVVNIEVPVRVLRNDAFVEGLTLADFEVLENGVPQKIEAVYLIKNRQVLSEEKASGAEPRRPSTRRNYVLYFDMKEYLPKVGEAVDYFFGEILTPEDSMFVVTPVKTYRFRSEYMARTPRLQIAERLRGILKTDLTLGNSQYRRLMRDFYQLEEEDWPPEQADVKETMLFDLAREMRDLTEVTEARLMGFAEALKSLEGEKHVFMFFQKDVLPPHEFNDERQAELRKSVSFDVDRIKRLFADSSITIHSLYITKTPTFTTNAMARGGAAPSWQLRELSVDVFAAFKEMAAATGGLAESTSNPNFAIRQAAEASSNYYLLYYRPAEYKADGHFQEIEIRVKGQGLKVIHRLGYIAD